MAADIRVIVATLPPADFNLGAYRDAERPLFAVLNDKIVTGSAKYGYDVVDYRRAMTFPNGAINPSLYADVFLHPNVAGCEAMRAALEPVLSGLVYPPDHVMRSMESPLS